MNRRLRKRPLATPIVIDVTTYPILQRLYNGVLTFGFIDTASDVNNARK